MVSYKTDFYDNEPQFLAYAEEYMKRYDAELGFIKAFYCDLYAVVKDSTRILTVVAELDWLPEQIEQMKSYIRALLSEYRQEETGILLTISLAEEIDSVTDILGSLETITKGICNGDRMIVGLYTDKGLWRNRAKVRTVIGGLPAQTV